MYSSVDGVLARIQISCSRDKTHDMPVSREFLRWTAKTITRRCVRSLCNTRRQNLTDRILTAYLTFRITLTKFLANARMRAEFRQDRLSQIEI
jgi:hypothetical protein